MEVLFGYYLDRIESVRIGAISSVFSPKHALRKLDGLKRKISRNKKLSESDKEKLLQKIKNKKALLGFGDSITPKERAKEEIAAGVEADLKRLKEKMDKGK